MVVAEDGTQAWEILQVEGAPRLALLDWMMPGMDGVAVCQAVRQRATQPYTYILLLTAKDEKRDVIAGLDAGADDYLVKPFHPEELKSRLRVSKRILALEDDLVAAAEALRFGATHDPLTGLWNRASILDTLGREVHRARREGNSIGIFLADLDHFKSINDTYGHFAGDEVLREAARRFVDSVRSYDAVGRYGGEEFLILLPGCDASSMPARAEQIRSAIGTRPVETTAGAISFTLSVGAVASTKGPEDDANALLRAADAALYRAKSRGRNRVELATPAEIPKVNRQPVGARRTA